LTAALASLHEVTAGHIDLAGEIRVDAQTLKLTLTRSGSACCDLRELDTIRERLAALHGARAKLDLDVHEPDRAVATLELPYAAA